MSRDLNYININKRIEVIPEYQKPSVVRHIVVQDTKEEPCDIVTVAVYRLRKWAKSGYPKTCDDKYLYGMLKNSTKKRLHISQAAKSLKILRNVNE